MSSGPQRHIYVLITPFMSGAIWITQNKLSIDWEQEGNCLAIPCLFPMFRQELWVSICDVIAYPARDNKWMSLLGISYIEPYGQTINKWTQHETAQ